MKKNILLVSAALVCACAVSRIEPLSVPLHYVSSPDNVGKMSTSCSVLSGVQVTDNRTDKTLGNRKSESKPLHAQVTTASSVADWVQTGMQSLLTQNRISFAPTGPALSIAVDSVHTEESIWHRASFSAQVALTAQLHNAAGKVCWTQNSQGTGGTYGYAGSTDNYQVALNQALDNANLNLVAPTSFKDALCSCGS
jgi:hypothetical protein